MGGINQLLAAEAKRAEVSHRGNGTIPFEKHPAGWKR